VCVSKKKDVSTTRREPKGRRAPLEKLFDDFTSTRGSEYVTSSARVSDISRDDVYVYLFI